MFSLLPLRCKKDGFPASHFSASWLFTGLALVVSATHGAVTSMAAAGQLAKNAVAHNFLMHPQVRKNLSPEQQKRYDRIDRYLDSKGAKDYDTLHQAYLACAGNESCRKQVVQEAKRNSQQNDRHLAELVDRGQLSLDELVDFYQQTGHAFAKDSHETRAGIGDEMAYQAGLDYLTEKRFTPGTITGDAWETARKRKLMRDYGLSEKEYRDALPKLRLRDEILQELGTAWGSGLSLGKAAGNVAAERVARNAAGRKAGGYGVKAEIGVKGSDKQASTTVGKVFEGKDVKQEVSEKIFNRANHVFGPKSLEKHNLSAVLEKFSGDQVRAFQSLEKATQKLARQGKINGVFERIIKLKGVDVIFRGKVVDGAVKIGTTFIP